MSTPELDIIASTLKEMAAARIADHARFTEHIHCLHGIIKGMNLALLSMAESLTASDALELDQSEMIRNALATSENLQAAQRRTLAKESQIMEHMEAALLNLRNQ